MKVKAFQSEWTLKYGLEVATRSLYEVSTSVLRLFCRQFVREDQDSPERNRKRSTNIKYNFFGVNESAEDLKRFCGAIASVLQGTNLRQIRFLPDQLDKRSELTKPN